MKECPGVAGERVMKIQFALTVCLQSFSQQRMNARHNRRTTQLQEQDGPLPAAMILIGRAKGHREPIAVRIYFFFAAAACSRKRTLKSSALNGK